MSDNQQGQHEPEQQQEPAQEQSGFALMVRDAGNLSVDRWNDKRIAAIKAMFAPDASIPQLAVFLAVADKYDLDPAMKEIWWGEIDGRPTVITGRDSFIKVAQRDAEYRGFIADVVRERDLFAVDRNGSEIIITHRKEGFNRGAIIGAYALVQHATREPVYVEKHVADLAHLTSKATWRKNLSEMILTRALTFALKLQYNISGLYSPADEYSEEEVTPTGTPVNGGNVTSSTTAAAGTRERLNGLAARMAATPKASQTEPVVSQQQESEQEESGPDYEIEAREEAHESDMQPGGMPA